MRYRLFRCLPRLNDKVFDRPFIRTVIVAHYLSGFIHMVIVCKRLYRIGIVLSLTIRRPSTFSAPMFLWTTIRLSCSTIKLPFIITLTFEGCKMVWTRQSYQSFRVTETTTATGVEASMPWASKEDWIAAAVRPPM